MGTTPAHPPDRDTSHAGALPAGAEDGPPHHRGGAFDDRTEPDAAGPLDLGPVAVETRVRLALEEPLGPVAALPVAVRQGDALATLRTLR